MWRDRLAAAARNIADLNESDEVRRLRARLAGEDAYAGASLAAARRAAAALDALWADYLLVSRAVDEAAALLRRPLFGASRAGEAAALLDGASIRMPAASVPLRARGLLDAAERAESVTPAAVLDAMERGFEAARRGAGALAAAETAARVKLGALRADPGARGPGLRARLDAAERALERDPLAVADIVTSLASAFAAARAEAEAAERRRAIQDAALVDALALARADLAALGAALGRAAEARRGAEGLPAPAEAAGDLAADLSSWLDRLAAAGAAGQGGAAMVGLARWTEGCAAALRAAEAEADGITAATRERDNLRGRFRALLAKAEAVRAWCDAPDPAAIAAALDGRPFDAARARALLAGFEARLGMGRR